MSILPAGLFDFDFFEPLPIQIEVSDAPLTSDAGLLPLRQWRRPTRTPFPSDDMATSMKRANLEAILDHPATQWVGFPVAGAAVGAALHPLNMALERARQSQHAGLHHGQQHGRHHGQPGHPHYTKLHHSMLAGAGVGRR